MSERLFDTEQEGPFGVADGHRSGIDEATFVELDPAIAATGLLSRPSDRAARIIVGKKGSGKTVYLRRFQLAAGEEKSVYAAQIDPKTPSTANIVTFCQWYRGEDLTERWSQTWRTAILRSMCSHLLYLPALHEYGSQAQRRGVERAAQELLPEVSTPRSPYNQLDELISGHASGQHLEATLSSGRWGDLEYWLGELIQDAPPVFFYLDAVDEEYAAAPNYWLRCQKGLFYQVMRFLRDPVFGGRLHIVISIRDNVLASVLRSEHATRYRTDPHVRILAWDHSAVSYLLTEKLSRLGGEHMMRDGARPTVEAWLCASTIENASRGLVEGIEDYLLRHTRLLPRDIVLLGNALCEDVIRAKANGQIAVSAERIRATVSQVAWWCGDEQLAVCGNQVLGDVIPRGAARNQRGRTYVATDEYRRQLKEQVGQIIRAVGVDQFDAGTLETFAEMARSEFGQEIDLPTVLWQNGLLGYRDKRVGNGDWVFHGVEDVDRFHVPLDREQYAFHPILLDTLGFRGAGLGSAPVRPWREAIK